MCDIKKKFPLYMSTHEREAEKKFSHSKFYQKISKKICVKFNHYMCVITDKDNIKNFGFSPKRHPTLKWLSHSIYLHLATHYWIIF